MGSLIELDDLIVAALKTARGVFLPGPRIARIRYEIGVDSTGNPVLQVWVILGDETPSESLRHAQFQPFADDVREAIRLSMRNYNIGLFQHVRFLLESEESGFVPDSARTLL